MHSSLPLLMVLGFSWAGTCLAQYGYTPMVPATPPAPVPSTPMSSGYPSTPQYGTVSPTVPPPGSGMSNGYVTTPGYGYDYVPPPPPSGAGAGYQYNMLSYGYLEGGYQYTDFKDSSLDASHGLGIALSAQLFKPLYIKAGFMWSSSGGGEEDSSNYDFSSVSLGAGIYIPLFSRLHLVGEVGGAYSELDATKDSLSFSDGSVYIRPGLRFAAAEMLELQAGVTISSSDKFDTSLFDLAGYLRLFSILDFGVGAAFGDESTGYKAMLRVRW